MYTVVNVVFEKRSSAKLFLEKNNLLSFGSFSFSLLLPPLLPPHATITCLRTLLILLLLLPFPQQTHAFLLTALSLHIFPFSPFVSLRTLSLNLRRTDPSHPALIVARSRYFGRSGYSAFDIGARPRAGICNHTVRLHP